MVENDLHVHGVTASTELQEDIPQIAGDPTQLQQVVLNLVKNAIEAVAIGAATTRWVHGNNQVKFTRLALRPRHRTRKYSEKVRPNIFDPFVTTKASGWGSRGFPFGGSLRTTAVSGLLRRVQKAACLKSFCRV